MKLFGRKLQNEMLAKWGGLAVSTVVRRWMGALDYKIAYHDERVDPAHEEFDGPAIFIFWHEYIPFLLNLRGHCDIAMLLSRHSDAEWLSQAARHLGFSTIRGSSRKGGAAALRELLDRGRLMNLAITPDGPRGPRRKLAQGPVFLASKLQIPLVAIGLGYDRPRRLSTWDKLAVPRPYCRARAVVSPALWMPPQLDRAQLEQQRRHVESVLNTLTTAAEDWAASGRRMEGQQPLRKQAARRRDPTATDILPFVERAPAPRRLAS